MAMLMQNFWERTKCIMGDVQIAKPQQSGGYLVRLFSADSPHKKLTTFGFSADGEHLHFVSDEKHTANTSYTFPNKM